MKFLLSATFVGTALAHPKSLNARADTTTTGIFNVFNVTECTSTGIGLVEHHRYEVHSTKCMNTPPNPDLPLLPYLSYTASVTPPAGEACFFNVFAGEGCTGNYQGFQSTPSNNDACQEVVVATTGNKPTVGAKSVRMSCANI